MTRIGIIGIGSIGAGLARLAVVAGDEVMMANSRGFETLADLLAELGAAARAGTAEARRVLSAPVPRDSSVRHHR